MKNGIWLFIIAIVILAVFLPSFTRIQDLKQKNFEYEEQIRQLTEKRDELIEEKRLLQEDPEYLERVARDKMGIAREGEYVLKLKPSNTVE